MRRLTGWILVLVVAVPLAIFGLVASAGIGPLARGTAALLTALAPRCASAQSDLQFKPVPADSVPTLERERSRRRMRVRVSADVPDSPEAPVPEPPAPPDTPEAPPAEHVVRTGDLTRVGSDIHIEKDEVVNGDVTAMRGDVTVDGTVNGSVVSFGGDVILNSTARVEGDVVCIGGQLREEPGAYVSGERVTALGGRRAELERRLRHARGGRGLLVPETMEAVDLAGTLLRGLIALGLTWLIAWLFQGRISAGLEVLRRQPGLSLGIGALVHALFIPSVIALALVVVLLCITIIGIPLALAALLGYGLFFVVFWLFGLTVGAAFIGQRIVARRGGDALPLLQAALIGVLVVWGIRFAGHLLSAVGLWPLGKMFSVLMVLVTIVLGTMGGGAWLKWEFESGIFGQWWGRARGGGWRRTPAPATAAPYGPPPASPYGPPAAMTAPEPAPPPPAPPESFMPPGETPPAPPAGPGPASGA